MKVTVKGKGTVNLNRTDFVAQGGQGAVYSKGNTAFKIYHNPSAMMPEGKIQQLAALPSPPFSRPADVLLNAQGKIIGYTCPFIPRAFVLCQLFPRAFRDREGLKPQQTFALAEKIRDGISQAHKAKILLVDINEMNFLVDPKFQGVHFIDTDSYQTPGYPATAIMESVRDRHMKHPRAFDEGTDWFSFACVSFQLLVGVHPYKGKHPVLKGFEDRMLANMSVLNPEVSVPGTAYPFSVIPPDWLSWYRAVLEKGDRCAPPGGVLVVAVVQPQVRTFSGSQQLTMDKIQIFEEAITEVWLSGHHTMVTTSSGVWSGTRKVQSNPVQGVLGSPQGEPFGVTMESDRLTFTGLLNQAPSVSLGMNATRVVFSGGRCWALSGNDVLEVTVQNWGGRALPSTRRVANVLPHATFLFPGGAVQNLLGSQFVSLFQDSGHFQFRVPELDKYRILDGKWDTGTRGGVLMLLGYHQGVYDRLVFRFDPDFQTYDLRKIEDVGPTALNFVVLDTGNCICLDENENLELSRTQIGDPQVKVIRDSCLSGDMRLFKDGAALWVAQGNRLFTMRMT